jgi:hypothetical protein
MDPEQLETLLRQMQQELNESRQQTHRVNAQLAETRRRKKIDVPVFTGKKDFGEEFRAWMAKVEKYREYTCMVDDKNGVIELCSGFKDKADIWLTNCENSLGAFSTITQLVQAVKQDYISNISSLWIRDKLWKIKQGTNGDVMEYIHEFETLCGQLPEMDVEDKLHRFCLGLNDKFRIEVEKALPENYEFARLSAQSMGRMNYRAERRMEPQMGGTPMEVDAVNVEVETLKKEIKELRFNTEIEVQAVKARGTGRVPWDERKIRLYKEGRCFLCEKLNCTVKVCSQKGGRRYNCLKSVTEKSPNNDYSNKTFFSHSINDINYKHIIHKLKDITVPVGDKFKFAIRIGDTPVEALVDSGCTAMVMSNKLATRLNLKTYEGRTTSFTFANGEVSRSNKLATVFIKRDDYECEMTFYVVEGLQGFFCFFETSRFLTL